MCSLSAVLLFMVAGAWSLNPPEDENDFDLFGPVDAAGATGTSPSLQPVPPGPSQQPVEAPAVQQVTVGLDSAMQQMMQSQQTMLGMLNKRWKSVERTRKLLRQLLSTRLALVGLPWEVLPMVALGVCRHRS